MARMWMNDTRCKRCEREIKFELETATGKDVWYINPCVCEQDEYNKHFNKGYTAGELNTQDKVEKGKEDVLEIVNDLIRQLEYI